MSHTTQIQTEVDNSGLTPNPLLSIVIPTYNRAEFLDRCLEYHISVLKDNRVQVLVFDNASTDQTQQVTLKWQKEYPLIAYTGSAQNQGADANFERALKASTTQYVWLLGDTYHIPEGAIEYIFDKLARAQCVYDMFIFNVRDNVKEIPTGDYQDKRQVLRELFPLITWMPALVYSAKLIQNASFDRFRDSSFIQAGIILDYIANSEFRFHWNRDMSVKMVTSVNGRQKDYWADERYFDIWISRRTNLIMSLPVAYSTRDKLETIRRSSHLGVKEMIRLRSLNIYTPEACREYAHLLPLNIQCPQVVAMAIVRTPRFLLSAFYKSYLFCKKIFLKREPLLLEN